METPVTLAAYEGAGGTRASDDLPGLEEPLVLIETALARRDESARKNQRSRYTFAAGAALLGPIAALFLACQIEFAASGRLAVVLILLELVLLTIALAIAFLEFGESHQRWIGERLRAEILRRERFLFGARVGPYLKIKTSALSSSVGQRLVMLDSDLDNPTSLLEMNDASGSWRGALEDSYHQGALSTVTDLPHLQTYLQTRVVNQREWFSRKCSQHRRHAWYFEGGAKLSLALALIIAAVHLGTLWAGDAEPGGTRILIVAAIFFPIAGAALVGLLSIFGCRRLGVSYAHHAEEMERLEKELRMLESNMINGEKPIDVLDLNFRRLLLETEGVLSSELRLWWMFMNPELPRASG